MYKLRGLLHAYPWMPAPVFVGAGVIYVLALRGRVQPGVLFLSALVWAACAFLSGRFLRLTAQWPRLDSLHRTEYSAVWDALSTTPDTAAQAAAGYSDEKDLRATGEEVAHRIADAVGLQPSEDVLEIGCGVGRIGWAMAPRSRSWTGCDISANMVAHSRRRLAEFQNVRLVLLQRCDLAQIESSSVDVVYCTNALPHMDQNERFQYVCDAYRILRPRGRLYIDTIALDSPQGWNMVENNLAQVKARLKPPPYIPTPSTPDELLAYFIKAGFAQERSEVRDSLLMVSGVKL
jgi:cyclopropane fatty-acyl-phospholipid synthase-like methyltransferase